MTPLTCELQGEQVFITYGLQSNDKLLQYYGFVEAKNPADVYVLPDLLETVIQMPHLKPSQEQIAAVQKACSSTALQQVNLFILYTRLQACAAVALLHSMCYDAVLCRAVLLRAVPCFAVLCCAVLSCCAALCRAVLCRAVLCRALLAVLYHTVLCHAVPCCAVPCCDAPCCAAPCCVMLCRAVPCRAANGECNACYRQERHNLL